jgi:putative transposase
MPWKKACPVTERMKFITTCAESQESFAELCRRFGISRKTGYKWLERFELKGAAGLDDRPPVAARSPHRTSDDLVDRIVLARKEHPFWGPKKLRVWLLGKAPEMPWPAASTFGELLKANGLIRPRRRRLRVPLNRNPLDPCAGPNDVWCVDYKGHFALGDGRRCHPLTITDGYSRYLLKCEAMLDEKEIHARPCFELAFREFGLPKKVRSDNGNPFASLAVGGLSPLSVWWMKLGIELERIEPGKPQQNGRHERMHRTLKEQLDPVGHDVPAQQRALDRFRHEYNEERPHEGIGQKTPHSLYALSMRAFPEKLRSPEYPAGMQTRSVHENGHIKWRGRTQFLAGFLGGEPVGLRELREDIWEVFYGPVLLGLLDGTGSVPQFSRADRHARRTNGGDTPDTVTPPAG